MPVIDESPEVSAVWSDLESNPHRVNDVNVVVLYGMPGNGKTSFCRAASDIREVFCISTDAIIAFKIGPILSNKHDFLVTNKETNKTHFGVFEFLNSAQYDKNQFITLLKDEFVQKISSDSKIHTIIIEGYALSDYKDILSELNLSPERTIALEATRRNNLYMINDIDVTGYQYDDVFAHIRETFRAKCLDKTIPKSKYQDFKTLGIYQGSNKITDSNTADKYECSHLDEIIQPSHCFVDIGCNAGYFCFRIAKKCHNLIVGVDTAKKWLEIASHINNSIFFNDNVLFIKEEAENFLSGIINNFNIIHCASTYHYFRGRQVDFLQSAHRALTADGRLVLEVELADTTGEAELVMRSRGVDATPCAFPNRAMFLEQIRDLFHIEAEFPSVFQRGSFYPRTYFHLRPL